MMKPVEEHCLTHRRNFCFFFFRSSRSGHVAMNMGSSSLRGSRSPWVWEGLNAESKQICRGSRKGWTLQEAFMVWLEQKFTTWE